LAQATFVLPICIRCCQVLPTMMRRRCHFLVGGFADAARTSARKRRRLAAGSEQPLDSGDPRTPISRRLPKEAFLSEPKHCQAQLSPEVGGRLGQCKSEVATPYVFTPEICDSWRLVAEMCGSRCAARLAMCSRKTICLMPFDPVGQAGEYARDIMKKMLDEHRRSMPCRDYMAAQPEINAQKRAVLVEWLVAIYRYAGLSLETLHAAISYTDRCLACYRVPVSRLHLVGAAAMMIAVKVEEEYDRHYFAWDRHRRFKPQHLHALTCPSFIAEQCGGACTTEEVVRAELSLLNIFEYRLTAPTVAHFIALIQAADGCGAAQRSHIRFLAEFALMHYRMALFSPLHIAASVIFLSNRTFKREPEWSPKVARLTKLTPDMFAPCRQFLLEVKFPVAHLAKHRCRESAWVPFPAAGISEDSMAKASSQVASLFDASVDALAPGLRNSSLRSDGA